MSMTLKDAITIVLKQVNDYDRWGTVIMDSLLYKKDLCKHPYPAWMGKDENPEKAWCMLCKKNIKYPDDVDLTWHNFDKQELVDAAVKRLKLEMKIQEVGSDEM